MKIPQILKTIGLFILGAILGGILFLPKEAVWLKALDTAALSLAPHAMAWSSIEDAGLTGFTLTEFSLKTQQGTFNLSIPKLKVSLGLSPLAEITATTGPVLKVQAYRDRSVTLSGGFDLAALGRKEMSGAVTAKGDMNFKAWGGPPMSGQLSVSADTLALPGGLVAEKVKAAADLADTRLTITNFEAEKPVPIKGQGTVDMVWTNPRASSYSLTGTMTLGSKEQAFQKSGTLEQVPGM